MKAEKICSDFIVKRFF